MKSGRVFAPFVVTLTTIWLFSPALHASRGPATETSIQMVVTAETPDGAPPTRITGDEVTVNVGKVRAPVTEWLPYQGTHAGLELFILIDDATITPLGPQLDELRRFILSQPPAAAIGVAYMHNGGVEIAQIPTTEHELAAKALRPPSGSDGPFASPYRSMGDLITHWPRTSTRRELLLISDGLYRFRGFWYSSAFAQGFGPNNPYLVINEAQRTGVVVYAIYARGVASYKRNYMRLSWGLYHLSEIAQKCGGEAYFQGVRTPASFAPFLDDLSRKLSNQYQLGFTAVAGEKGKLEKVEVHTPLPEIELIAARRAFVPGREK